MELVRLDIQRAVVDAWGELRMLDLSTPALPALYDVRDTVQYYRPFAAPVQLQEHFV